MRDNYKAWEINPADFFKLQRPLERLRFLVNFAALAPSSHNSQPWKFLVRENTIYVLPEPARSLPVSDADGRHMHIALGCAVENICIAADYYGYRATVEYFPEENREAVALIVCAGEPVHAAPDFSHLLYSIPRRRSNRNPYADKALPEELAQHWKQGVWEGLRADIITESRQREQIASVLVGFRERIFADASFRKELAGYKRTNFTRKGTGMPGFTMGFGDIFSLIAPFAIRRFNVIKFTRDKDVQLLAKHSPAFIFLSTKEDAKNAWLTTGRVFMRMLLEAERESLHTSVSAIPHTTALQGLLGTAFYPQIFFRVGYAKDVPGHSPRLLTKTVLA